MEAAPGGGAGLRQLGCAPRPQAEPHQLPLQLLQHRLLLVALFHEPPPAPPPAPAPPAGPPPPAPPPAHSPPENSPPPAARSPGSPAAWRGAPDQRRSPSGASRCTSARFSQSFSRSTGCSGNSRTLVFWGPPAQAAALWSHLQACPWIGLRLVAWFQAPGPAARLHATPPLPRPAHPPAHPPPPPFAPRLLTPAFLIDRQLVLR
jgi:hypothetical protein